MIRSLILFNENLIITGSRDKTIKIWDVTKDLASEKQFLAHSGTVCSLVQLSPTLFASGGSDCLIKIWNIDDLSAPLQVLKLHTSAVYDLITLSVKDHYMASCGEDTQIVVWELKPEDFGSSKKAFVLNGHTSSVNCLC